MRYLAILFGTVLAATASTFVLVLYLAPARVEAEYWIRPTLVTKRQMAIDLKGKPKILLTGGSSTLFGINAKQITEELGVPAVNMAVHVGLPLSFMLSELEKVVEPGDIVVLALEPHLLERTSLEPWWVRSTLAWNPEFWDQSPLTWKIKAISTQGLGIVTELIEARWKQARHPESIPKRLKALDDQLTIQNFRNKVQSGYFEYAYTNLDEAGDLLHTDEAKFSGPPSIPPTTNIIYRGIKTTLENFVSAMNASNVAVYFAPTPFLKTQEYDEKASLAASREFVGMLSPMGESLGFKSGAVFERKYFFDSNLHLNTEGRKLRTDILLQKMQSNSGFMKRVQEMRCPESHP